MKPKYIGTYIPEKAHGTLRVMAAQEGGSIASLLKRLALDFIAAPTPTRKTRRAAK